ncbi:MAG TPA: 3-oxoacyl-[acyl-carrier-protein] synthase III C-terminal domain-containing protein [Candidatus Krumholzibacteria bacterium]|nr:3-oxoacyl-[acyl-carrier-protein] synthase III C-terminal domain-containing protein [Candidatus Krumholzibacteria bacterium]
MKTHPRLIALATAAPPHVVPQAAVQRFAAGHFSETIGSDTRLLEIFDNAEIEERHLCVPLEWLAADHTFAEKNDRFIEHAVGLAADVTRAVLQRAHITARDVDHLVFVSSTGIATPSIDAILSNEIGFRPDFRRTPVWGLGCAGGAAGLSLARDLARAEPSSRVLLIALELCSLTFQHADLSRRNLVATSLFADGAAAALVAGPEARGDGDVRHAALELVASHSMLWPDTLDVMGWTVDGDGLHVVFSRDIPAIVHENVRPSLAWFLSAHGLRIEDVAHIVTHPGGVKVLRAYADALGASPDHFAHARAVLREFGNMSSPSCLFVLERFLDAGDIAAGDHAVIAALGPGFSAEYVLARGAHR